MNTQSQHTKSALDENPVKNPPPWEPTVYSPEEQARLDSIYAEWEEAHHAHEAFKKQILTRLMEVWNDNISRVSQKKGLELQDAQLMSWSNRIKILLKREGLWKEEDEKLMIS